MAKIKICGLMRTADVDAVNEAQPDYAGFVFAGGRHHLETDTAAKLIARLHPSILPVGVFVNEPLASAAEAATAAKLSVIQLHGDETAEYAHTLRRMTGCAVWKAVRVRNGQPLLEYRSFPADRFLLDAFTPEAYGGTGNVFDWQLLDGLPTEELILAGGLTAENVQEAVMRYHPFAVDVSSGAETEGQKDVQKIKQIVSRVRNAHAGTQDRKADGE